MGEAQREEVLRALEQSFGERIKRGPIRGNGLGREAALASVLPMSAEEVELLARVAARFSVPLVAAGAGTASAPAPEAGGILIRFDLMRNVRLPEHAEPWVEAEPGPRGCSWMTT
jgi:FAD/FMN-containing dehydrogenase